MSFGFVFFLFLYVSVFLCLGFCFPSGFGELDVLDLVRDSPEGDFRNKNKGTYVFLKTALPKPTGKGLESSEEQYLYQYKILI